MEVQQKLDEKEQRVDNRMREMRDKKEAKRSQLQAGRTLDKITYNSEENGRIEFREVNK